MGYGHAGWIASVTPSEAIELAGWLFSAWVSGYAMGFIITAFRKFADKL